MKKGILLSIALIFLTLAGDSVRAQVIEEKKAEKAQPTSTTVDVWRESMPQNEEPFVVTAAKNEVPEVEESSKQIEKRIIELATLFAESLEAGDSATLRQLLTDDFVPVGRNFAEAQTGKNGFIDRILKNGEYKSFAVEKMKVRVYGTDTAIVTVQYKKVSKDGAALADGGFIATDVWVKRGNFWQAASHHVSPMPKP